MSFHETVYLFGGIISDFGTEESNSVSIYEHDAWVIQGKSYAFYNTLTIFNEISF